MTNGIPQNQERTGSETLADCSGALGEVATIARSLSTSSPASPASSASSAAKGARSKKTRNVFQSEADMMTNLAVGSYPSKDGRDDALSSSTIVSETMPTPLSGVSPSSPVSAPPLSLLPPGATKPDQPRPGVSVRFSDAQSPACNPGSPPESAPVKKPPWSMYRRTSSTSGESMPTWGVLFDGDGFVTARCGQVFRGLARCLVRC
ncbi:hypothetical protein GGR50DRAFT_180180 [Xylaria sp. CBS 124048]|nr:hypothetical protein GGR50DRAFT_180180 [Xylaria sp. CBS 124048]